MKASEPTSYEMSGSGDQNVIENHVDQIFATSKSTRTSPISMNANGDMEKYSEIDSAADIISLQKLNEYWKGGEFARLQQPPYTRESLEPHMSGELYDWLYQTNHNDNVVNLVRLLKEANGILMIMHIGLNGTNRVKELVRDIRFYGQLHANNQFFWECLAPCDCHNEKEDSSSPNQATESSNPMKNILD